MKFFRSKSLLAPFVLCFLLNSPAAVADQSKWTELPKPLNQGTFTEPHLLDQGSRIHLIWAGTDGSIQNPEVYHSYMSEGDNEWKKTKAPFFGQNKSRVRKVAIGQTRNLIGILFQRSLRQGNDAYEVLLSVSSDQGWSWSNTVEIDSFNAEKTGGTGLSIEGRQGANRPEFAMSWIREYGNVRAANFDFNSTVRPEGVVIGKLDGSLDKVEVGTLGKEGFSAVFNAGSGLATSYIRGLTGKIEEGTVFLRGRYGNAYSVSSRPYGPSRLVVGTGSTLEAFTSNETSWKNDQQTGQLPFPADGTFMASDLDDEQNLHVVMVRPNGGKFEIWYVGQNKQVWGTPEMVSSLDGKDDLNGFDITATDKYVFVAACQGYDGKIFRKKLK